MDLVWKMLEGGATVIENIIIYDFYSKFFGYKRESVYNACVEYAIRLALDKNAGEQEWMKFVEILNNG